MILESLIDPGLIFPDLAAEGGSEALRVMANRLGESLSRSHAEELFDKLVEREKLCSTAIGGGVAIPHCKLSDLDRSTVAVGIFRRGVEFGATDGKPVRLFVLLVSPDNAPAEHLQALASISRWLKSEHHVERILKARDRQGILDLLEEESP